MGLVGFCCWWWPLGFVASDGGGGFQYGIDLQWSHRPVTEREPHQVINDERAFPSSGQSSTSVTRQIGPVLISILTADFDLDFGNRKKRGRDNLKKIVREIQKKHGLFLSSILIGHCYFDRTGLTSISFQQKEIFAEALLNGPIDKVNNWRTALKEAANLEGFHLEADSPEPEFIEEIVETIWKILYVESPTGTIPPCRQNGVPSQYSSLIIAQKGAVSKVKTTPRQLQQQGGALLVRGEEALVLFL
nr:hypothetical protein CFP56_68267 [Quercus suber]